jgi:hypothetical protein
MPVCGGWAFLCSSVIRQASVRPLSPCDFSSTSPGASLPLHEAKAKTGPPLYKEVAGCAAGSARLFGAHVMRAGFKAFYFRFMSSL